MTTSGNDLNDGKSWANAFADVQTAIDAAAAVATDESPSEVWIAKGAYKLDFPIEMKNNVAIYGGFAGTENSLDERKSGNETILDGKYSDGAICNNYSELNPLASSAKLDSVKIISVIANHYSSPTIANCIINADAEDYGIFNNHSSPTITNCKIFGNHSYYGAGIGNYNSSAPTITNCTIMENDGDGICNIDSSPTIANCTICGNGGYISSASMEGYYGSGIYNSGSSPTIINCTISENISEGIRNFYSSSPAITNCTIIRNGSYISSAWMEGYYGWGIRNDESSPMITNCIIWGNYSSSIFNENEDSTPVVKNYAVQG
ncbi:MAG: right-handed parallel beta-helix repeat-containing protein, partial [Opitutales bacterium]|nr:right-handed parallel beta-helix repeat-containing protein [Opitutales bacterium]